MEKAPMPVERGPVSPGVTVLPPGTYAPSCYGPRVYYYPSPGYTCYPSRTYYEPSGCGCRRGFRLFRR